MLSEAKHLGLWGVTPPQMLRRYAPQHDITDMTGVLTHPLSKLEGEDDHSLTLEHKAGDGRRNHRLVKSPSVPLWERGI